MQGESQCRQGRGASQRGFRHTTTEVHRTSYRVSGPLDWLGPMLLGLMRKERGPTTHWSGQPPGSRYEVRGTCYISCSYWRTCPSTRLYIWMYRAALLSQPKSRAIASRIISSQPCVSWYCSTARRAARMKSVGV